MKKFIRPALFGGLDGLVTNAAILVGMTGVAAPIIILTGIAGMIAGAFSMAIGEFISVDAQNRAEVASHQSPLLAALSSFVCFALGAILPLTPLLLGFSVVTSISVSILVAFGIGAGISGYIKRKPLVSGVIVLAGLVLAVACTFAAGTIFSVNI